MPRSERTDRTSGLVIPLRPPATGIDGCGFPAGEPPILGRVPGLFLHPFHIPMGRTLENKQQIVEELKQHAESGDG